jgi:hypothetical protein
MNTKLESPTQPFEDPLPNPEPVSPSLPEPDTGVYHHEPAPTKPQPPASKT